MFNPRVTSDIVNAFKADGFTSVTPCPPYLGMRGFRAEDPTKAVNTPASEQQKPGFKHKTAFYVEGTGQQMGYLMGYMAEEEINRLANEFPPRVAEGLIEKDSPFYELLMKILMHILEEWCEDVYKHNPKDIPAELQAEMTGIVQGIHAKNPNSNVGYEDILRLNAGIDCLLSAVYTLAGLESRAMTAKVMGVLFKPEHFRLPMACNAFVAFLPATSDGKTYLGRDFQFPAAGGFSDCACLVVSCPNYQIDGRDALPMVSQTAPGIVGSVTAMNAAGVGLGVDVVIGANCHPDRPGLNSLLLVRQAALGGYSAADAVKIIRAAPRGVTWLYPIGDSGCATGANQRSPSGVIAETGMNSITGKTPAYLKYAPQYVRNLLSHTHLDDYPDGLALREHNYHYPTQFLGFNKPLFAQMDHPWIEEQFGPHGSINSNWKVGLDKGKYFHPQREDKDGLVVVTNIYIIPEMRLSAMNSWTEGVAKTRMPDLIWRYDALNDECLSKYGRINHDEAIKLINFLSPEPGYRFPDYYRKQRELHNDIIDGSVSLCNLTDRIIESHFGYQTDDWVGINLPNYIS